MVTKVYGKVDGIDVILQKEGDRWTVPVPLDEDGEYVVEIIAEDDAGNLSYLAKMLFVINKAMIKSYMIPLDYAAEIINTWQVYGIDNPYRATVLPCT